MKTGEEEAATIAVHRHRTDLTPDQLKAYVENAEKNGWKVAKSLKVR